MTVKNFQSLTPVADSGKVLKLSIPVKSLGRQATSL